MELNTPFFVLFLEHDEIDATAVNRQEGLQPVPFLAQTSKKKDD